MYQYAYDGLPESQKEKIKFIYSTSNTSWKRFLSSLIFVENFVVFQESNKSIYIAPNGEVRIK
jgi:hypothetical protein